MLWHCFVLLMAYLKRCGAAENPPHIIFVVADDLGWNDVGWHNPDMHTPNLDKYANLGVILNSSYVQPMCSPSRTSFLTGYFPYHTSMQYDVIRPPQPKHVPENFTFLPELLKTAGYQTHMVGKWHLGCCNWKYTPTFRGFDTFFGFYNGAEDYYTHMRDNGFDFRFNTEVYHEGDNEYSPMLFASRVEQIIKEHNQSVPLFLYMPFQSVHTPHQVPTQYESRYRTITSDTRRVYCGMVTAMDEAFGRVMQAVEHSGLDDNLLLIFTSDNGGPIGAFHNNYPLRGGKGATWEGGTKVAAFVYSKTLFNKTGYVNDEMIHAVDWFATILDLAGLQPEDDIDGVSQVETIVSGAPSKRTEFVYNIDDVRNLSAIRYGDFKLMKGGPGWQIGEGPGFHQWYLPTEYFDQHPEVTHDQYGATTPENSTFPEYMLFNIKEDPFEQHDLSSSNPEMLEKLKERLNVWMQSLVPAQNPPPDDRSDPSNFNYVWSPGWC